MLLRLTEDKAALQLQLRDAQVAAQGAQAAAEERDQVAVEVESTCQELRRQLEAAMEQHDVAHAAVEGAADHLQQLSGSHEGLERQLAGACAELEVTQGELAARTQLAGRLEQAAMALDAELRQALHQRDSTYAQLQEAQRQLAAAQEAAAAQHHAGGEMQQRLNAAGAAREEMAADREALVGENASLKENLLVGALKALCLLPCSCPSSAIAAVLMMRCFACPLLAPQEAPPTRVSPTSLVTPAVYVLPCCACCRRCRPSARLCGGWAAQWTTPTRPWWTTCVTCQVGGH